MFIESVEDLYYVSSTVLMLVWVLIYNWQRKKNVKLLVELDEIVEKRSQNVNVSQNYHQTSAKIDDLMETVHLIMMQTLVPFVVIAYISILVYKQLFWDYISNSFCYIFSATLHFNLGTPVGFLIGTIVQIATVFITTDLFIATLMVISQLRFFEVDFILDLKQSLKQLNDEIALAKQNEKLPINESGNLKRNLIDLMQFFSTAKEFIKCFDDVNDPLVYVYILYASMSFGGLLFQIRNILIAHSMIGILQVLVPASISVFWLCYFCYFGYRKVERIEELGDDIQKLNIAYLQL
ncbi:uncharacterized protein LOC129573841 isoform X1 [Sitodiplosis mosellana]|uniref:uncharacterized protein LOC129573841 isoform X1 n=1 Tax=Sitodiplosis mosellana TaxID=263140 RepID=UPI002444A540|nr:uncharacterized protein LOC129573841 isoform X1 [Sitodiplosis mosellana]